MLKESNGTICNYLSIDLDLYLVKVILILDFSVILGAMKALLFTTSVSYARSI